MRRFLTISFLLCYTAVFGQLRIVVAIDGSGDFKSIQGAINSLADSSDTVRTIFIKKGVYREKIYIEKNNIELIGEDRSGTIITASIARDIWRCGHTDDWGVATLNVGANDISLKNLNIINSFGFDADQDIKVNCPGDSLHQSGKPVRKDGHQMALRTMNSTRLRAVNCHFKSFGGDTVSPWNVTEGMWYFKDCIMEGGVDLYCPRGWAWAENCTFIVHSGTAAIWHDGSANKDSKSVLINCTFKGTVPFILGRYHRDAQIYLVDCVFEDNMMDKRIERVANSAPNLWGQRIYFADCRKTSGLQFNWYANNLPSEIKKKDITVKWVFGKSWKPEK